MLTKDKIVARFLDALEQLADDGKAELFAQGHKATGRGIASVEAVITSDDLSRLTGAILANDYLVGPINEGVSASRVPFSGTGGGGSSKYIDSLIRWAQVVKPGLSLKEARSFAFAVAQTAKQEGHPTNGSFAFSKNGRRTAWIENGIEPGAQNLEDDLRLFELVADSFEQAIARAAA